jgi:glutathione-regulated potassium-efflux system ancillary protein KefC
MQNSLFEIFIFLAAACIMVPLASRFKLSSVLGYLIAGILIGPFALGLIANPANVMHFAQFGVVMMLFVIGLELEPAVLWRLRTSIIGLGGLQLTLTTAAFTLLGMSLGYHWQLSLAAGMALGLSSTALVLQMLNEKKLMDTLVGKTAFSILLFQDIAVIPILVLMPLLATKGLPIDAPHTSLIAELPGWLQALIVAGVISLVILGGRYLAYPIFRTIARTNLREVFTALSLALIVGIALLMELIGVSPALGAFVAGVVLANSEYRHTLETDIEPFKGLLLGLFFISVGMGIDFTLLLNFPLPILAAVATLMLIKAAILWMLGRAFALPAMQNIGFAFALSQGGEFAFVLFQFAGGLSILQPEQAKFLTLVVALSIAATPLIMLWYNRAVVPHFTGKLPQPTFDSISEQSPIIVAGFGRFGQIIGRFLSSQGLKLTVLEKDPDQIEMLRKYDFKGYFGDATRLDLLESAGAKKARLLIIAVDDVEASLEIARLAATQFPDLTVFARARNRKHAYLLHKLGIHYFKRELFDSSLAMAKDIMIWLGHESKEMTSKTRQFRAHDETSLQASFEFFEDESAMVDFAKTNRAELAQILQGDIKPVKGKFTRT